MRWKADILVAIAAGFAATASVISCSDGGQGLPNGSSSGGAGNNTGGGGTGESCLAGPPQQCPLSSCGNGIRDTCMAPAGFGFCPFVPQTERCDGTDLNGETCQTLGYGSGTLACSSICSIDTAGCSECLPPDASLLRCGDAPFSAAIVATGVSATDSEVAVAWLELDATSRPILGFARLTPSLDLIGTSRLMNAEGSHSIDPSQVKVRAAPLPSGWLVAGYYEREVFVHAVSTAGQSTGRTTIDKFADGILWAGPILAPRPNGGPLVVWETPAGIRASVIASDGRSATPPATIASDTALASWLSAAFIGDAFYVAFSVNTGSNPAQLRLVRVGSGGEIGTAVNALPGLQVEVPKLVTGGNDLRIMYSRPSGETVWQLVSLTGAALSPPVAIDVGDTFTWSFAALPSGSDTIGLLVGTGAVGALGAMRLASDGSIVAPPRAIARAQPWLFGSVDVARRGPDVVLLWGALRLARVTM